MRLISSGLRPSILWKRFSRLKRAPLSNNHRSLLRRETSVNVLLKVTNLELCRGLDLCENVLPYDPENPLPPELQIRANFKYLMKLLCHLRNLSNSCFCCPHSKQHDAESRNIWSVSTDDIPGTEKILQRLLVRLPRSVCWATKHRVCFLQSKQNCMWSSTVVGCSWIACMSWRDHRNRSMRASCVIIWNINRLTRGGACWPRRSTSPIYREPR